MDGYAASPFDGRPQFQSLSFALEKEDVPRDPSRVP